MFFISTGISCGALLLSLYIVISLKGKTLSESVSKPEVSSNEIKDEDQLSPVEMSNSDTYL